MIFQKKRSNSIFTGGMQIPKTAQDTIPFWEVYENGLFLVGEDKYTLIFSFENLDYSLLRETEQKDTYEGYQKLLNALPTDINELLDKFRQAQKSDDSERKKIR